MKNYYEILGVKKTSKLSEIKQSFRRKAKELHPDLQDNENDHLNDEAMRLLIEAYQVLSHPQKKKDYDKLHFRKNVPESFNFREFLKSQSEDMKFQTRLIFYDLLNFREDQAIELFLNLYESKDFEMNKFMEREDYLECLFLLSEEFEKRGEYLRAYHFLKTIYMEELENPFFHHFIDEITDRIRSLLCYKMLKSMDLENSIEYLQEAIDLDMGNKATGHFYKKMAELYFEAGLHELASQSLLQGLRIYKKLAGIKKLKQKIGITEFSHKL
ncbi:MAG: DnaJ domain-containing protein [Spirochaetales bacterium]|nr:DnaJ domain-containing protein [Spirochaetales bacterium]